MTFQPVDPTIPLFSPPKSTPLAPRSVTAEMLAIGSVPKGGAAAVTFSAGTGVLTHNLGYTPTAIMVMFVAVAGQLISLASKTATTATFQAGSLTGTYTLMWIAI